MYNLGLLLPRTELQRDFDYEIPFSTVCTDESGHKIRVFQFPQDYSLGTIQTNHGQHFSAQGDVLIPSLEPVAFWPSFQCCEQPQTLGRFRKDEIRSLWLQRNESAVDAIYRYVDGWTELTDLHAGQTNLSDKGLRDLVYLPKLVDMTLNGTLATGEGIGRLPCLKQLQVLYVGYTSKPAMLTAALKHSLNMRVLHLRSADLTDAEMKDLSKVKSLYELYIIDNPRISDRGIAEIASLPHLQMLDLDGCGVTVRCIPSLQKMPELRTVKLREKSFSDKEKQEIKDALRNVDVCFEDPSRNRIYPWE